MFPCADANVLPEGRTYLIVGTAAVSLDGGALDTEAVRLPAGAAVVANMAVNQRHRGLGIARLLLQACEKYALALGLDWVGLAVHKNNAPAQELYLSSGYTKLQDAKPIGLPALLNLGLPGSKHIAMVKQLGGESPARQAHMPIEIL